MSLAIKKGKTMFEIYKGFEIQYHNHCNQFRDYFVIDSEGECVHYTGSEQSCYEAIDSGDFNLVNKKG